MKSAQKIAGVTLVELMIVVALVGIIASIAYPSYQQHVVKTNRSDSTGNLMQLSQFMERFFSETGGYNGTLTLPFTQSPTNGSAKYNITVARTATTYTLTATPTGSQTSDTQCGALTLNQSGVRCIANGTKCSNSGTASVRTEVANCW